MCHAPLYLDPVPSCNTCSSTLHQLLSSDEHRYRLIAVKLLPSLAGYVSEGVAAKLQVLLWDDWSEEVVLLQSSVHDWLCLPHLMLYI